MVIATEPVSWPIDAKVRPHTFRYEEQGCKSFRKHCFNVSFGLADKVEKHSMPLSRTNESSFTSLRATEVDSGYHEVGV